MSQKLIEKLRSYIEFNKDEEAFIRSVFKLKHFAKGEHFLLAGGVFFSKNNRSKEEIFINRGE